MRGPAWAVAWRRRTAGVPILGRARVNVGLAPIQNDQLRASEASSDRYGGPGSTVTVVAFPGDPAQYAWDLQPWHDMAPARDRVSGRSLVVPPPTSQTVSNLKRIEVARQLLAPVADPLP